MASVVTQLEYLRTRSQVDLDSQDPEVAQTLGPFVDCTSNQIDAYTEFVNPQRAELMKESALLARQLHPEFPGISYEELAVEIGMVKVSLSVAPFITGSLLVMANPILSNSAQKTVENALRLNKLCRQFGPEFDISRLCIKVPATWEGLQACRKLKGLGIRTLATTLFTMEQAILAGEAGCSYISPFGHELKALLDETYKDEGPFLQINVEAQNYYQKYSYDTRVKAAGLDNPHDVLKLAGVATITIPAGVLQELAAETADEAGLSLASLFHEKSSSSSPIPDKKTYLNDKESYLAAFAARDSGKGQQRTTQAVEIFSEYQKKAEAVMAGF